MTNVVCVGIAVIDLIFEVDALPQGGGKHYASSFREVGGGVAANAAVAVARLGGNARYIGRVGDDALGEQIIADLIASGVEVTVDRVRGVTSPVSSVLVDAAGERTIVNHTPRELFDGGDVAAARDLVDVDAVLVDVRWPDGAAAALRTAAAAGVPSVFDFDRPMESGGDALLGLATHVVFSAAALAATAGTDDPVAGLAHMAQRTDAWLAVTVGPGGVHWRHAGESHHLPAFAVDVVDTLGAGDVFHGALALALGEGQVPADAVRFASAAAALKCTRPGGRSGTPDRADVHELLQEAI
jgi:sulfofructose kinase